MISFICLFMPALMSYCWLMKIKKEAINFQSLIRYYPLLTVLMLLLNALLLLLVFKHAGLVLDNNAFSVSFVVRYLLLSLVWGILIPLVIVFIEKNTQINVEMKRNEQSHHEEKK